MKNALSVLILHSVLAAAVFAAEKQCFLVTDHWQEYLRAEPTIIEIKQPTRDFKRLIEEQEGIVARLLNSPTSADDLKLNERFETQLLAIKNAVPGSASARGFTTSSRGSYPYTTTYVTDSGSRVVIYKGYRNYYYEADTRYTSPDIVDDFLFSVRTARAENIDDAVSNLRGFR